MTKTNRPITDIEWLIVLKFRELVANRFGTVMVAKVWEGKLKHLELGQEEEATIKISSYPSYDANELIKLQSK